MEEADELGLLGTAPLSGSTPLNPGSPQRGEAMFGAGGDIYRFSSCKEGQE